MFKSYNLVVSESTEEIDIKDLKLTPIGSMGSEGIFLCKGSIPAGFREATEAEVQQSTMYQARKKSLNTQRQSAITAGVEVPDIGTFDTDQDAQLRVAGGLLLSMLPIFRAMYGVMYSHAEAEGDTETMDALGAARTAFQVPWILKDNTSTILGFDEFKQVGPAVSQHVAEQVHAARAKKDAALQNILNPVIEEEETSDTEAAPATETVDTSETSEAAQ